jgi:two-component system chemotaxis response regulator CheY
MKILIVDDFSTMRRIIKNLLRDLGFTNTAEADDGTTALPMLQSGAFDFLVTDWNMPGMSEAAQAGVNGYVVKPFTAQVLKEKIEKIFERVNS